MPPVFYLTDSNNRMCTCVPVPPGTRVRVKGTLYMHSNGGVLPGAAVPQRTYPYQAYLSNPTTLPTYKYWATTAPTPGRFAHADALSRLGKAIWPVIWVHKITAVDQKN